MNEDFRDLLTAFIVADVRFLIVGAYAVGIHGHPRATKDIDLWVEASRENAARVMQALRDFGAPLGDLSEDDLAVVGTGFMMGIPPRRIDVLTQISGIAFEDAWMHRVELEFDAGLRCPVISAEDLITNKTASGRPQDVADVTALNRLRSRK